jgi:hypothetical protein
VHYTSLPGAALPQESIGSTGRRVWARDFEHPGTLSIQPGGVGLPAVRLTFYLFSNVFGK